MNGTQITRLLMRLAMRGVRRMSRKEKAAVGGQRANAGAGKSKRQARQAARLMRRMTRM